MPDRNQEGIGPILTLDIQYVSKYKNSTFIQIGLEGLSFLKVLTLDFRAELWLEPLTRME